MKRIFTVLTLAALLAFAGCKEKKTYTQSDIKQDSVLAPGTDVDFIGLYLRAHDLDSIKNVAVAQRAKAGMPMPALPDSLGKMWDEWTGMILLRQGEKAFDFYDSHREDFAKYLRLDFIGYGFTTQVYLPYMATTHTEEEYGEICIRELESEFVKVQQQIMAGLPVPSHYDNLLNDLFFAYANFGESQRALTLSEEMLSYTKATYGEKSLPYANTLNNKANLCHNMGNAYSAGVAARQAVAIYDALLKEAQAKGDEEQVEPISEKKNALEEKLKQWSAK